LVKKFCFRQKNKFSTQISTFDKKIVKKVNFQQKFKFSSKNTIFVRKTNFTFRQKINFWQKTSIFDKKKSIFGKKFNFRQKNKFWTKNSLFDKNFNFRQTFFKFNFRLKSKNIRHSPYIALAVPFSNPARGSKSAAGKFFFKLQIIKWNFPIDQHWHKNRSLTPKSVFFISRSFAHNGAWLRGWTVWFGRLIRFLGWDTTIRCLKYFCQYFVIFLNFGLVGKLLKTKTSNYWKNE